MDNICKINNEEIKEDIAMHIRKDIMNGNLDGSINKLLNKEKESILIEDDNIKYEIITTNNDYNENKNISIVKLGECENKLKKYYKIDELIIYKIDVNEEGLLIPIVEYEIYDIFKNQLDLNICKDIKIETLLPCVLKDNEYKYNSSSEYYNDICYSYTTKDGTDIILTDRRNEFIDNNMSLCESNCEYDGYNSNIKKAICKCEIKLKIPIISEIKINKDRLLNMRFFLNY